MVGGVGRAEQSRVDTGRAEQTQTRGAAAAPRGSQPITATCQPFPAQLLVLAALGQAGPPSAYVMHFQSPLRYLPW
jgi:hypothetical protein